MNAVAAEPSAVAVLGELRELVNRHAASDDVGELLDELGAVLRRARAAVRRAVRAAQPAVEKRQEGELVGKPAAPSASARPGETSDTATAMSKGRDAAASRQDRPAATGPVLPTTATPPAGAGGAAESTRPLRRAAPPSVRVSPVRSGTAPDAQDAPHGTPTWRGWRQLLRPVVLGLAALVAVALGVTAGVVPALVAAVVLVLVTAALPLLFGRVARRGHCTRDDRPPGRT